MGDIVCPPPRPRLTIAVVSFAAPAACNEVRGPVPCRPWPLAASELGDSGLERWAGGGGGGGATPPGAPGGGCSHATARRGGLRGARGGAVRGGPGRGARGRGARRPLGAGGPPPPGTEGGASPGGGAAPGGEPCEGPVFIPHAALALEGFGAVGAQQSAGAAPPPFEPSDAFCTALDREPEESPEDRVALGLEPLHLHGDLHGAGAAPCRPPPTLGPRIAQGSPQGPPPARASRPDPSAPPPRKRVRFAPQSRRPSNAAGGGRRAWGEAVVGGGRRRVRGAVPDHVRNPGNYTCYSLEEPLYVGHATSDGVSNGPGEDMPAEGTVAGDWGRDYLSEEEAGTVGARQPGAVGHVFRPRSVPEVAPWAGGGSGSGGGASGNSGGGGGTRSSSQGLLSFDPAFAEEG